MIMLFEDLVLTDIVDSLVPLMLAEVHIAKQLQNAAFKLDILSM